MSLNPLTLRQLEEIIRVQLRNTLSPYGTESRYMEIESAIGVPVAMPDRPEDCRDYAAARSVTAPFRASIALTEFSNAIFKTPLPMVLSTNPSIRPLRFLPSRIVTKSISVMPLV
jgi:hypothetical protein